MKILHINSYYGDGMFYKNLYDRQISDYDLSVYVPLNKRDNRFNNDILGKYCVIDPVFSTWERFVFFIKEKKIYNSMIKKYKNFSFDLIHAHTLFVNGFLAYCIKCKYGVPYIVAVRNTDLNIFWKYLFYLRKTGKKILINSEQIICISEAYKEKLLQMVNEKELEMIKNKIIVIPNGIDDYWFDSKKKTISIPTTRLNFICVARIEKNKNMLKVCQALNLLVKNGYEVHFVLVGKIIDKKYYSKVLNYEFVEYKGIMNKQQLSEELKCADIFVMPSFHETFGLVYAEAMTKGLPLIYTKGEGFYGQFQEGEIGYGVSPNSSLEIYNAIKKIIMSYNNYSSNCINKCERYNWDIIAKEYSAVYESVVHK